MNNPYSSAPPPTGSAPQPSSGLRSFLDSLGEAGRVRPSVNYASALVAIGGGLLPVGLAYLFTGNSDSASGAYIAALLTFAAAFVLRFKSLIPTEFMSATTSGGVVSLVLFFLLLVSDSGMEPGLGLLIAGAVHIGLWFAPGFRGASLFLSAGTFVTIAGLVTVISGNADLYSNDLVNDLPIDLGSYLVRSGIAYLVLGLAVIVGVYFLDRYGYPAIGTALVAPGMIALVVGIFTTSLDMDNAGTGVLFFLAGAGLCYTGHKGGRRAMTWWGTAITGLGIVVFVVLAMEPDSGSSAGLAFLISAAVLIAGPTLISKIKTSGTAETDQ